MKLQCKEEHLPNFYKLVYHLQGFPGGTVAKNSPANAGDTGDVGSIPGSETATHSSILAWEIQWTEKPGGLQAMGLQIVGDN